MSVDHYTYRVTWSAEDDEHVGLCAEFPSLSWLAKTPEAALKGIRRVVSEAVVDMQSSGETIPVPLAEKHYSGEFRVRIPPQLHRALATEAAEQGVSLNRLASAKLAA
ncbi:MAG TPA: toxin-antitoxin system HicB family antitoxin [Rhodocyclaceae bacterium]|nr:toxin-antitoxin system HicB family antitoxin [Rhodocyclaceae bacterium]